MKRCLETFTTGFGSLQLGVFVLWTGGIFCRAYNSELFDATTCVPVCLQFYPCIFVWQSSGPVSSSVEIISFPKLPYVDVWPDMCRIEVGKGFMIMIM